MKVRTIALGIALVAGAVGPAATAAGARPDGGGGERILISITEFRFTPRQTQIHVGDRITWINNGTMIHTSTSNTNVWNSGNLAPGQRFTFTFNQTGTFQYHCAVHPIQMTGTIRVVP